MLAQEYLVPPIRYTNTRFTQVISLLLLSKIPPMRPSTLFSVLHLRSHHVLSYHNFDVYYHTHQDSLWHYSTHHFPIPFYLGVRQELVAYWCPILEVLYWFSVFHHHGEYATFNLCDLGSSFVPNDNIIDFDACISSNIPRHLPILGSASLSLWNTV